MSQIQYTPHVGPFTTEQPVETRLSWQRQQPEPVRRRGILTALTVAACVWVPTFAQGSADPPTGWRPSHPDRVERRVVHASQQPAVAWHPDTPGAAPTVPDLVLAVYPDRLPVRHGVVRPIVVGPLHVPDVTDPVPALSWGPQYPTNLRSWPRRAQVAPLPSAPLHVPDVTQPVTALSWNPRYPDAVSRLRTHPSRMPFWAMDRFDAPTAAAASPAPDRIIVAAYTERITVPAYAERMTLPAYRERMP